jgi:prophage regulatory protein
MRVLDFHALKQQRGIDYSRVQLWRLVTSGRFPRPIVIGGGRLAWLESEIDDYLKARIAERDGVAA